MNNASTSKPIDLGTAADTYHRCHCIDCENVREAAAAEPTMRIVAQVRPLGSRRIRSFLAAM